MDCIDGLRKWIETEDGFAYYLNPRFLTIFKECEIRCMEERAHIEVSYRNYVILDMSIQNKSIVLLYDKCSGYGKIENVIQKKLNSEYIRFFNLKEASFRITQYNLFAFLQYMEIVKRKIDVGFEKYSKILEMNIKSTSLSQLQIGISNVFSLEELENLIDAYNRLYSLIYYACEHGIDAIDDTNISKVEREYNMVLESIHIGSDGFLASVGAGLIVELVKALISSCYEGNRIEAEKRKNELSQKAQMEENLQTRQYIFQLINLLDSYLQKREQGCHPGVLTYIECEINTIVTTIEQLQGTSHIDVLC